MRKLGCSVKGLGAPRPWEPRDPGSPAALGACSGSASERTACPWVTAGVAPVMADVAEAGNNPLSQSPRDSGCPSRRGFHALFWGGMLLFPKIKAEGNHIL